MFLLTVASALPVAAQNTFPKDTAAPAQVAGVVGAAGFSGKPKALPVFKNRAYCGDTVPDASTLIGADGGLRNAVILLRAREGKAVHAPGRAVLDNQKCAFTPRVQVVMRGTEVLLKNSDPILHTVRARQGKETLFNVGLPRWRQVTKTLDRAGVVRIDCDVLHTWMSAAIVVADTPHFALTDEKGRFTIDGLSPGAYEMEVWHERLGRKTLDIALAGGGTQSMTIIYSLPKSGTF